MKRLLFVLPLLALGVLVALLVNARSSGTTTTLDGPGDTASSTDKTEHPLPAAADPETSTSATVDETFSPDEVDDVDLPAVTPTQPTPPADARPATVRFVFDGDSFDIIWSDTGGQDEVRLIGVNATGQTDDQTLQCFGDESRETLRSLIEGEPLLVGEYYRDRYGRVLGDVWVGDVYINGTMAERGAALAFTDNDSRHGDSIVAAQDLAKQAMVGLWSPDACGADPSVQITISDIVFDAPGLDNENRNGEWIDVFNMGDEAVDLSGWTIRDESTGHRFDFPAGFALGPNELVRVFSGCGDASDFDLYWCDGDGDPIWNNAGDTGYLVDADGLFVDTFNYGS